MDPITTAGHAQAILLPVAQATEEMHASNGLIDGVILASPAEEKPQTNPGERKKVAALHFGYADGLRALAVFYVFVYHAMIAAPQLGHSIRVADLLMAFNPVDMFFILSGFLLSGPFLRAYLHDGRDFPLVGGYFLSRIYRCFPVYYIGIAVISLYLWYTHVPPTWWDIVAHVLYIEDFSPATSQTLSGPLWTMAVDVQFYIALPILFGILFKYTRKVSRERRITILFSTLVAMIVACIAYRYIVQLTVNPVTWELQIVWLHQLPGMACVLAVGIGVRAFLETASVELRQRIASWPWLLIGGAFALHFVDWAYDVHYDRMMQLKVGWFDIGTALFSMTDLIAAIGCMMFVLVLAGAPTNPITRLISGRVFVVASTLSFAFYVFHYTVLRAFAGPAPIPSWPLFFTTTFFSLAILVPLCWLEYRFVETPFLKIKSTVKRSKRTHVPDWTDVQNAGATVVDARLFPGRSEQA